MSLSFNREESYDSETLELALITEKYSGTMESKIQGKVQQGLILIM